MGPKKGEKDKNQNIQVAVRCRPLNSTEKKNGSYCVVDLNPERREVNVRERLPTSGTKTFTYDRVFGTQSKQIEVYESMVVPILEEVLQGYNCTMFAYGQTGTGKTFTMEGNFTDDPAFCWNTDPNIGIIPRSMGHLFHRLDNMEGEYSVRVSYLEIYNEELMDLLGAEAVENPRLKIYEDSNRKGSCIINGLEEAAVQNCAEVYRILQQGSMRRQTASTLMNARSSRSHSVFMVTVHMKENSVDGEELLKIGKLNLVDLAGSECIGRSGAVDRRAREAGNINQSLLTLGRVITALVERASHVPYRESKLTRLLQDSLGGRTKTSIIATVSPASCNIEETMSTLDYAYRAKNITNRPEVNQKLTKKTLMKEYNEEIERLRRDLQAARDKNGVYLAEENYTAMTTTIAQQTDSIKDLEERFAALDADYIKISTMFTMTKEDLEERTRQLEEMEQLLRETESSLRRTRKDRDEQKHLVGKHLEAETHLLSEAKQLLTTADESTNDVKGLHAKLDRKRDVESVNETVQQTFQQSFKNCTDAMADEITVSVSQQTEQVSCMQEMLREMIAKRSDEASTLKSSLSEFNTSMTEQLAAVKKQIIAAVAGGQSQCSELTSSITEAKDEELCRQFSFLEETFKSKMEDLQHMTTSVLTDIREFKPVLKAQFDAQSSKVSAMESGLLRRLEDQQSLVSQYSDELSRNLKDHETHTERKMKEHAAEEEAIASEVIALLQKMSKVRQSNCEAVTEDARLVQVNQLHSTFVSGATSNVSDLKSAVRDESEQFGELSRQQSQISQAKMADFDRQLEDVVQQEAQIQTDAARFSEETVQILEKNASASVELVAKHVASLDALRETHVDMNETCCSNHEEKTTVLRETVDANNRHSEEDVLSQVTALSDHAENLTVKSTQHKQQLADRNKDVDNFILRDLKKDLPTGTTPPRRDFKYPVKLTRTDRHSLLLSEFREQYVLEEALNTPIPEDSLSESVQPTQLDLDEDVCNISSDSALSSASGFSVKFDLDKDNKENREDRKMRPPSKVPQKQSKAAAPGGNSRQPLRSRSPTPQRNATRAKTGSIPRKGTESKISRPAVKS